MIIHRRFCIEKDSDALKTMKGKGNNVDHSEKKVLFLKKTPFASQQKEEKKVLGWKILNKDLKKLIKEPKGKEDKEKEKEREENKEKKRKRRKKMKNAMYFAFCINPFHVFKQHCIISLHKSSRNKFIACHNMASITLKTS